VTFIGDIYFEGFIISEINALSLIQSFQAKRLKLLYSIDIFESFHNLTSGEVDFLLRKEKHVGSDKARVTEPHVVDGKFSNHLVGLFLL
jgi:hypothetical protein